MKITKKVAKELFKGNFEGLDYDELLAESPEVDRARTNTFMSKSELVSMFVKELQSYHNLDYTDNRDVIKVKDFEGLERLDLVYLPNEDYSRFSKGHLQTTVFSLVKRDNKYYAFVSRMNSRDFHKRLNFSFDKETHETIVARLVSNQSINF